MAIKPFQWKNLKKISGAELHIMDSLFELVPFTSSRERLPIAIRKVLMKHLGEKAFFYLDRIDTESFGTFFSSLPDASVMSVIGMEPIPNKLVVQIDNNLAFLVIDRLLGGTGEPPADNRRLSETEQGVVQYFIMQILAQIWKTCGESSRVHFRFEKFAFSPQEIENIAPIRDLSVVLNYKVGIGELSGFVKVVFPANMIQKISTLASSKTEAEEDFSYRRIDAFNYIRTTIWAEAGHISLSAGDIAALEPGDVMIFDESGLVKDGSSLAGAVELKVGSGESGSLLADVTVEGRNLKCTLNGG